MFSVGTIRLWLILVKVPMFSLYWYAYADIFLFTIFTDANHYRMFAITKSFVLVTQHVNGCCHSFFWFNSRFNSACVNQPKNNKKAATFYRNCLIFKWCHQKMSFIYKWLYIFALKNRNKRNLPLLLHLNSAPFCSVSQSRVPTLMQSYCFILKYKRMH